MLYIHLPYHPFEDMTKELASSNDALIDQQSTNVGPESEVGTCLSYFLIVISLYLTIVPRTRSKICEIVGERNSPKKKSYLIVSFEDYYSRKWCAGHTLFYRY